MADKPSYIELLKDPRWQRKRLEILERDNWLCANCFNGERTLHVHHRRYLKGHAPWEYDNNDLVTLCERCHGEATKPLARLRDIVGYLELGELGRVIGYVEGTIASHRTDSVAVVDYGHAEGIAASIGVTADEVVTEAADQDGKIDLKRLRNKGFDRCMAVRRKLLLDETP